MITILGHHNFKLNRGNYSFLEDLTAAESDHGVPAAILASIITAEAVMRPFEDDIVWDHLSYNEAGEAAGLAQFTATSWLAHAARVGSVVNLAGAERGYIGANHEVIDRDGLLQLRYDAGLSVALTAEMARRNYNALDGMGIGLSGLSEGAVAKVLYLAHHEGVLGAYDYLTGNRRPISREHYLANVPRGRWKEAMSPEQYTSEYYAWLEDYIDRRIDVRRYLHESASVVVPRLASLVSASRYRRWRNKLLRKVLTKIEAWQ